MANSKKKKNELTMDTNEEHVHINRVDADKITMDEFLSYKSVRDSNLYELYEITKIANACSLSFDSVLLICDNYNYLSNKFSNKTLDKKKKIK
jgi:hypothetical protein